MRASGRWVAPAALKAAALRGSRSGRAEGRSVRVLKIPVHVLAAPSRAPTAAVGFLCLSIAVVGFLS